MPALQALHEESLTNPAAAQLLSDIARDAMEYLTAGMDVDIKYDVSTGIYKGGEEASLGLSVEFEGQADPALLAALAKFAENFNQQQVHVLEDVIEGTNEGEIFQDGSYNTHVAVFHLKAPITKEEAREMIQSSGLNGLTITDEYISAYYSGDPNDEQEYSDFEEATSRLQAALEGFSGAPKISVRRVSVYGKGRIPFEKIKGELRTGGSNYQNQTSLRIAARLAGKFIIQNMDNL